jgi:peptidoglycan-associated lipoprotein
MILRTITHTILLASLALTTTSCALFKKKKKGDGVYSSDSDFIQGTPMGSADGTGLGTPLPDRTEGSNFRSASINRTKFAPVQFGYDRSDVSAAEQAKVRAVASALRSSGESVIVAGFTDERGTQEYNRQLGERRAQAVRNSLISSGLSEGKIQTVSFGAEMPVDPSSNESAWAKNRRAEFGVSK